MLRQVAVLSSLMVPLTLGGCASFWPFGNDEEATLTQSETVREKEQQPLPSGWVVVEGQEPLFFHILKTGKGLLTPVMSVLPDDELIPDYFRSAELYADLRKSGLKLVSGSYSWRWHNQMVAAVEETCPNKATDPLPSCKSRSWYSWVPGVGAADDFYDKGIVGRFLGQVKVDYLMVPDPGVYEGEAVRNMRYAKSSQPLVEYSPQERRQLLNAVRKLRINMVMVERDSFGRAVNWSRIVAHCDGGVIASDLRGSALRKARGRQLDRLRKQCVQGLTAAIP